MLVRNSACPSIMMFICQQEDETDRKLKWATQQEDVVRETPTAEISRFHCDVYMPSIPFIRTFLLGWILDTKIFAWSKTFMTHGCFNGRCSFFIVSYYEAHLSFACTLFLNPCSNMTWQNGRGKRCTRIELAWLTRSAWLEKAWLDFVWSWIPGESSWILGLFDFPVHW